MFDDPKILPWFAVTRATPMEMCKTFPYPPQTGTTEA